MADISIADAMSALRFIIGRQIVLHNDAGANETISVISCDTAISARDQVVIRFAPVKIENWQHEDNQIFGILRKIAMCDGYLLICVDDREIKMRFDVGTRCIRQQFFDFLAQANTAAK